MLPPKDLDNRLRDDVERPVAVSQSRIVIGLVKGSQACKVDRRPLPEMLAFAITDCSPWIYYYSSNFCRFRSLNAVSTDLNGNSFS